MKTLILLFAIFSTNPIISYNHQATEVVNKNLEKDIYQIASKLGIGITDLCIGDDEISFKVKNTNQAELPLCQNLIPRLQNWAQRLANRYCVPVVLGFECNNGSEGEPIHVIGDLYALPNSDNCLQ